MINMSVEKEARDLMFTSFVLLQKWMPNLMLIESCGMYQFQLMPGWKVIKTFDGSPRGYALGKEFLDGSLFSLNNYVHE